MKTSGYTKHYTDGLIVLVVFGIFAVCTVIALFAGADGYERLNERDGSVYSENTLTRYITNKVRAAESPDSVSVTRFGDGSALAITEEHDGGKFVTYIYENDGNLTELFAMEDTSMDPDSGEKIISCRALDFKMENGLLTVSYDVSGETETVLISVRGEEGAE